MLHPTLPEMLRASERLVVLRHSVKSYTEQNRCRPPITLAVFARCTRAALALINH